MPVEGYFPNIDKMTDAQIADNLAQMGLDQPMVVPLFNFFKGSNYRFFSIIGLFDYSTIKLYASSMAFRASFPYFFSNI